MAARKGSGRGRKKPFKKGEAPAIVRVRLPKQGEILGQVIAILGSGRMMILCNDGKERMGRIPGKMRKRVWVREGDAVAVKPWSIEGDKKADVVWRYRPNEKKWLKEKGYLKVG
ncbi:MAG: translation initiation factor eIF-1A [Candidatus Micrarchaeia archaeon]